MRVLTGGFERELTELLRHRRVSQVDIASAWVTEGGALMPLNGTSNGATAN